MTKTIATVRITAKTNAKNRTRRGRSSNSVLCQSANLARAAAPARSSTVSASSAVLKASVCVAIFTPDLHAVTQAEERFQGLLDDLRYRLHLQMQSRYGRAGCVGLHLSRYADL